jgi:hypothetical protein
MELLNDKTFKDVFFSTKWRLWVNETWTYSLWLSIVGIVIWIICDLLIREIRWWYNDFWNYSTTQNILRYSLEIIQILASILLIIMDIFVRIKRAHDLWRKWSRLWCLLIPIYNIIVWLQLSFYVWKKEDNEYWKYNGEKLPSIAYIILIVEFIIVIWRNFIWDKIESLYEDKPLAQFNERVYQNEKIEDLLLWNDDFDEESRKITKDIVDTKLNCDCFWENATEKPNIKVDENFWNSVYEELEPKLLELAENPKYNK